MYIFITYTYNGFIYCIIVLFDISKMISIYIIFNFTLISPIPNYYIIICYTLYLS